MSPVWAHEAYCNTDHVAGPEACPSPRDVSADSESSWTKLADRLEELSARLLRMANDARRRAHGELLEPEEHDEAPEVLPEPLRLPERSEQ